MDKRRRRSFTLRFENEETHELLALLSNRMGVSMNRLAEYRGESRADVARFARAEVTNDDPLAARMVTPKDDPYDIAATFTSGTRKR